MELSEGALLKRPLSSHTILTILDKRFQFNGVQKIKQVYKQERKNALEKRDFDEYAQIYNEFEEAILEALQNNLSELLRYLELDETQFHQDYAEQF